MHEDKSRPSLPVIIYEGCENAGKTTVKRMVNEMINHQSLSFERWTGTQYAYAKLHGRPVALTELWEMDYGMDHAFRCILVFLYAGPAILQRRVNTDPIPGKKYELSLHQLVELMDHFFFWFSSSPFRCKMAFNTTEWEASQIAERIAKKFEEAQSWR